MAEQRLSPMRALQPVETEPGVLVHPTADRRLATEHWLLSTVPKDGRDLARTQWEQHGVAILPLGTLFSAVRIPGNLVMALANTMVPAEIDAFLGKVLDGPVICDPVYPRYYALVPATMPATWRKAAQEWQELEIACLGRDTFLGVPRVDAVELDAGTRASYWSVPMASMAMLCEPLTVARLIAAGRHQLVGEVEA